MFTSEYQEYTIRIHSHRGPASSISFVAAEKIIALFRLSVSDYEKGVIIVYCALQWVGVLPATFISIPSEQMLLQLNPVFRVEARNLNDCVRTLLPPKALPAKVVQK